MSFKLILAFGLSLILTGVLSSCGLRLGEKAPGPVSPTFSGKGYSCVGQIPEHFDRYFKDQMSEPQITEFVQCLQKAFSSFAQLTRGRDQSTYRPEEIRSFLQSYFLKDRPISDQLMNEFMIIKQVLIGGAKDRISRVELNTAIEVLEDLRVEAIRLKPHIAVLNPALARHLDQRGLGERLARAGDALRQTIAVFAGRLEKSRGTYSFTHLNTFLTEFRLFVNWDQHFPDASPVKSWIEMLKSFKSLTVNPIDTSGVRADEWTPLLRSMSRWYLEYLQYDIGVKGTWILQGVGLQNVVYLGQEAFALVQDAITHQPTRVLTFDQLMNLAESLQNLKWLPDSLEMCGLRKALEALVSRLFGDPRTPPDLRKGETGLGMAALNSMESDFYRWAGIQGALDAKYKSASLQSHEVPKLQGFPSLGAPLAPSTLKEPAGSEWVEFLRVKDLMPRPLFPEEINRVYLVASQELKKYNLKNEFYNLSIMNLLRSMTTLVFRGYARDGVNSDGFKTGIRSSEMQKFYEDFRDVGIDLGIIDRRNFNAGSRAFIEGNLFTYSSDGLRKTPVPELDAQGNPLPDSDDKLSLEERLGSELTFTEAMEYFAFLYSGGQSADDLYHFLVDEKCKLGPLDINQRPKLGRLCVQALLPKYIELKLSNMPDLQVYLKTLTSGDQKAYVANLMRAIYSPIYSTPDWVEYNELTTLTVVMHYAEAVMTRYDLNGDGVLDTAEIHPAEDVFYGFIQAFAKERLNVSLTDSQAVGAFRYILYYKEMPTAGISNYVLINTFALRAPDLKLDRNQLSDVFRVILAKLFETKVPQGQPATCHK